MHLTPYQRQAEAAKNHFPQRPRIMKALGVAILVCLQMSWANAKHQEVETFRVDNPALEAPPTSEDSSTVDASSPPVVIEGEQMYPDDPKQKFREALGPPPSLVASEHQFGDGSMELSTRFGRFCAKPVPGSVQLRIGGDITLAARCASY